MTMPKTRHFLFVLLMLCGFLHSVSYAGDLAAGRAKAEMMCQTCHGMDGQALAPMVAHISGQQEDYIVGQLENYRSGKRHHEQMTIISQSLTDEDIANLATWYSSMKVTIEVPE